MLMSTRVSLSVVFLLLSMWSFAQVDLELRFETTNPNPTLYTYFELTATLTNTGTVAATDIDVKIDHSTPEVVYHGESEYKSTHGTFEIFKRLWSIERLEVGESAKIDVMYFPLTNEPFWMYGEVVAVNEEDLDSSPNNGVESCCRVFEDDQALQNFWDGGCALEIVGVDYPNGLVPDEMATIQLTVRNTSGEVLPQHFVGFYQYLESTSARGAHYNRIGDAVAVSALAPGESETLAITVQVPSPLYMDYTLLGFAETVTHFDFHIVTTEDGASRVASERLTQPCASERLIDMHPDYPDVDLELLIAREDVDCFNREQRATLDLTLVNESQVDLDKSIEVFIGSSTEHNPRLSGGVLGVGGAFNSEKFWRINGLNARTSTETTVTYNPNIGFRDGFEILPTIDLQALQIEDPDGLSIQSSFFFYDERCTDGPAERIDLELDAAVDTDTPEIFSPVTFTYSLRSNSTVMAYDVVVKIPIVEGLAYTAHETSGGFYDNSFFQEWVIDSIRPREIMTLELKLFNLTNSEVRTFSQIIASPEDLDSMPDNNDSSTPAEDDETVIHLNRGARAFITPAVTGTNNLRINSYPNPVQDHLYIDWRAFDGEEVRIQLLNQHGRQIVRQTQIVDTPVLELVRDNWNAGIYFLQIESATQQWQGKVVVID